MIDNIKNCLDEFIKNVNLKSKDGEEWYNDQLKAERTESMGAYEKAKYANLADDWKLSKSLNKKYTDNVKKVRNEFYQRKFSEASGNQKETWKILKKIVNGQQEEQLDAVEFGGNMATNNYSIVNKFNEYYIESIEEINASITKQTELEFVKINRLNDVFTFMEVRPDDVNLVLHNILAKGDPELLTKDILIDAMPFISSSFVDVVNSSLGSGKFPAKWKTSIISPIPKVPGTIKGEEHRPVNQLPSYEKIIEGVVKIQLEEFINKNRIIIDEQFAFRETYSCELALNELIWNWKKDVDEGFS